MSAASRRHGMRLVYCGAALWAGMAISPLTKLAAPRDSKIPAPLSNESAVNHGTINIVLANRNGMVVLTDSMATSGDNQLPNPSQKLFKLDDKTVCAIAGFLSGPAPAEDVLTETAAIIRGFSRQLATEQVRSIEAKLRDLAFIFEVRLTSLADLRQASGDTDRVKDYALDLTIAGYDTDGLPKIGKLSLRASLVNGRFDSSTQTLDMKIVRDELEHQTAGIPALAEELIAHPDLQPENPALIAYAASMRNDRGNSLSISQMTDVAKDLALQTHNADPRVGGPNQIAILSEGRVLSVEQPDFPDNASRVKGFGLLKHVGFSGEDAFHREGEVVCVECKFEKMHFALDESYMVASSFNDLVLTYDGGPMYFDKSNSVKDCVLVLGPHAHIPSLKVHDLVVDFPWARVVRNSSGYGGSSTNQ